MGIYCTTTTLETLWGGASFSDLTSTAQSMITQSESEINKQLSARYDVAGDVFQTTTSIPPMVRTLCEWLSLGYLYENTARGSKDSYARADRYIKKAEDNLKKVLEYKFNLVNTAGSLISDNSTDLQILSGTQQYHTTFNEDDPLRWNVDPDKLNDISDERNK